MGPQRKEANEKGRGVQDEEVKSVDCVDYGLQYGLSVHTPHTLTHTHTQDNSVHTIKGSTRSLGIVCVVHKSYNDIYSLPCTAVSTRRCDTDLYFYNLR